MDPLSIEQLFQEANVSCTGSTAWEVPPLEKRPGVYVTMIADPASVNCDALPEKERRYWSGSQPIFTLGDQSMRLVDSNRFTGTIMASGLRTVAARQFSRSTRRKQSIGRPARIT